MKDVPHSIQKLFSDDVLNRFLIYQNVLKKWQKAINIVSNTTVNDFWTRHILDSVQIAEYVNGKKILDIGSGGGFPGMVLAICSDCDVTSIDSDTRKMLFLQEVARQTSTKITIVKSRIEDFQQYDFDCVCARGFANLSTLVKLTHLHSANKHGVFLKGVNYQSEIQDALKIADFDYSVFDSKTNAASKIIALHNIKMQ